MVLFLCILAGNQFLTRLFGQGLRLIGQTQSCLAVDLVFIHGIFEIIAGALLFSGYLTRTISIILFIDLLDIISLLGWGEIAVRDLGLAAACFRFFFWGIRKQKFSFLIFLHSHVKAFLNTIQSFLVSDYLKFFSSFFSSSLSVTPDDLKNAPNRKINAVKQASL